MKKPDFICIGMQKAGTRTLFDLLSFHESYWMPILKEFHHFDRGIEDRQIRSSNILRFNRAFKSEEKHQKVNARRRSKGLRPLDDKDRRFLELYETYLHSGTPDKLYLELIDFCPKDRLTGDITPAYSTLNTSQIKHVQSVIPWAKIILLVRDPVARAWSHINMKLRHTICKDMGINKRNDQLSALMLERFSKDKNIAQFFKLETTLRRSFPSVTFKNWRDVYGEDSIKVIIFDEFIRHPDAIIDEITIFLGGARRPPTDSSDVNRKASLPKIPITREYRKILVEMFTDEIRECRALFGDKIDPWLEKYSIS